MAKSIDNSVSNDTIDQVKSITYWLEGGCVITYDNIIGVNFDESCDYIVYKRDVCTIMAGIVKDSVVRFEIEFKDGFVIGGF